MSHPVPGHDYPCENCGLPFEECRCEDDAIDLKIKASKENER